MSCYRVEYAISRTIGPWAPRNIQYINRTHGRTGTLWDSRYKSSLIQAETYLLACMRYIELNPVRAAMVDDPAHYRWTSYRHNGLGQTDSRLRPHPLYLALGPTDRDRQAAYRALFEAHLDQAAIDDIRLALNQDQPSGNSRFYARIEKMTGLRCEARRRQQGKECSIREIYDADPVESTPLNHWAWGTQGRGEFCH